MFYIWWAFKIFVVSFFFYFQYIFTKKGFQFAAKISWVVLQTNLNDCKKGFCRYVCICSCLSLLGGGYGWMMSTLQWPLDLRATDPARPLFLLICPQLCVALKHRAQVSEQTSISLQSHWKVCNATAAISGAASCVQKDFCS